jgi:ubiquitin C-terminal hydrolase
MDLIQYEYDVHKNYELRIKKDAYKGHGLCGILNMGGNKCYLNSILQCLSNSLKLTDYVLCGAYKNDLDTKVAKKEHYFLNSYTTFLNHVWDENQIIKPKSIVENLGKLHRKYFSLQQQDSHECLLYILNILHKSVSYEIEVEIKGEVQSKKDELMKKSLESWRGFFEKEYSFIVELFYGNLMNNITCNNNNCNINQQVFEPYNNLSLSIDNNSTLQECLDEHFNLGSSIDTWKCEKCNETGCTKSTVLWTLPNYLIINLKRFKGTESLSKNTKMISYPIKDLNLTKYVSNEKGDLNNYIYDLYAINYHGGDLNSGHYWSNCKNLDGNWYNFNDGNVSKINNASLESQLVTSDSYILFYSRKFIKKTLQI